MESTEQFLIIFFRVFFIILVPAVAVFFRLRKKIRTGFTAGIMLVSFLLGVLVSGSIQEDPVKVFTRTINTGNEEGAKIALKRVIQLEGDAFGRIDAAKITRPDLYRKLVSDLVREYGDIARRHYQGNRALPDATCDHLNDYETAVHNLGHALRVSRYAAMLGGGDPSLRNDISASFDNAAARLGGLRTRCGDARP